MSDTSTPVVPQLGDTCEIGLQGAWHGKRGTASGFDDNGRILIRVDDSRPDGSRPMEYRVWVPLRGVKVVSKVAAKAET